VSPRVSRTLSTVEPILLTAQRDPFDDPAWLFEPKYDGYRGQLYVTRQGCFFRSKRGNILKRFEQPVGVVPEEATLRACLTGLVLLDRSGTAP
jgi:bifunctional non-homologous end joining protein LigD